MLAKIKTFLKDNIWIVLVIGYIFIRSNNDISLIKFLIPICWTIFMGYSLFAKQKYFRNSNTTALYIKTQNDDTKIGSMIISSLFIIALVVFLALNESDLLFAVLLIIAGILALIDLFMYTPSGLLKFKSDKFHFGNSNKTESIEVHKLSKVEISSEDIKILDLNGKNYLMNFLNLNQADQTKIRYFFKRNLDSKTEVI